MARFDLTDFEWFVIQPLLPNKVRGVARVDDRRVLNGIFWRLRTGAPWADIPGALRSAYDLREPLQPVEQGRRVGSHSVGGFKGLRWRRSNGSTPRRSGFTSTPPTIKKTDAIPLHGSLARRADDQDPRAGGCLRSADQPQDHRRPGA